MMLMETDSTAVPRLPVEAEAMHGRVTGLLRDLSSGLLVALSRGHPARIPAKEVDSGDVGVVGVGAVGDFAAHQRLGLLVLQMLRRRLSILP